jgi:hypothetical protein
MISKTVIVLFFNEIGAMSIEAFYLYQRLIYSDMYNLYALKEN